MSDADKDSSSIPTPRTDACQQEGRGIYERGYHWVKRSFARQLERELAETTARAADREAMWHACERKLESALRPSLAAQAVPMVLNKPLLVVFEQEGNLVCHLWPREDDTHASYGLIACDIVRHAARAFKVDEDDVCEWVDKERRKQTTSFSSPS